MNTSRKFSIIVWACNITLFLLVAIILASSFYLISVPGLTKLDKKFDGATKFSTRISHSFLSDYFLFERVFDKKKGIDTESYFFSSARNLYKVPVSDSIQIDASKIDKNLSSTETNFSEMKIKKITVKQSAGKFPIRLASPAIPLNREEYISLTRSNILFFILKAAYFFIFVWFLRKFISGLRKPDFFNHVNSRYLYIVACIVTIAPLFIWGWTSWVRPKLYSEYIFENAEAIEFTSSMPVILFIFGITLLVIAWCFDQGVKLQDEQKLTV